MTRIWFERAARAALVLGGWLMLTVSTSAHRLDEYLQATRVAVDRDRVDVEIDLTPGAAVARQVFAWIDSDGNGQISAGEGDAYARLLLRSTMLEVDDDPRPVTLVEGRFPTLQDMTVGMGTIRVKAAARVPPASSGRHRLVYRNAYRPEMSVYLVNALVPRDEAIQITGQARDVQQHELRLDYRVAAAPWPPAVSWRFVVPATMASLVTVIAWRRGRRARLV